MCAKLISKVGQVVNPLQPVSRTYGAPGWIGAAKIGLSVFLHWDIVDVTKPVVVYNLLRLFACHKTPLIRSVKLVSEEQSDHYAKNNQHH